MKKINIMLTGFFQWLSHSERVKQRLVNKLFSLQDNKRFVEARTSIYSATGDYAAFISSKRQGDSLAAEIKSLEEILND